MEDTRVPGEGFRERAVDTGPINAGARPDTVGAHSSSSERRHGMTRCVWRTMAAVLAAVLAAQIGYAQKDAQGCEDYPLLSRMEGFYIEGCKDEPFSSHAFQTQEGKTTVEGHFVSVSYRLPEDAPGMSGLEMIRNYTNAVEAIGGKVTYEGRYSASMRVMVGDRTVWVEVLPYGNSAYRLEIIEKQAMTQQVVADAAALLADLDRSGYAVLHGVLFDTDKAVIKPESKAALDEIAKLLNDHPTLEAYIVGHNDMSGSLEHNIDLSNRRAAAVVEALVADYGISASRLEPRGVGPLAPVASNDNDDGKALNRRVVLVKRR
jgi:OmpA-OmpF porin, OOP family